MSLADARGVCAKADAVSAANGKGLATFELIGEPGLLATDSDDSENVIVGFTTDDRTFRWTARGGTQILTESFSVRTTTSRSGSLVAGVVLDSARTQHAAVWSVKEGWQQIAPAYTNGSYTARISRNGRFVAGSGYSEFLEPRPLLWSESFGAMELPQPPNTGGAEAQTVSEKGDIVAGTVWHPFEGGGFLPRGIRWVHGSPQLLEDEQGILVGQVINCNSDCSTLVGSATIFPYTDVSRLAYRWTQREGVRYLPHLAKEPVQPTPFDPGVTYVAQDVTEDGQTIVGIYQYFDFEQFDVIIKGFIWNEQAGMREFAQYLAALGQGALSKWRLVAPSYISKDGKRVVGWGQDDSGTYRSFIVQLRKPC